MSRYQKIYDKLMSGRSDKDMSLNDILFLLDKLGLQHKRTRGDHFQYGATGIAEQINIQPKGGKVKPYQVNQIRNYIRRYGLEYTSGGEDDEL